MLKAVKLEASCQDEGVNLMSKMVLLEVIVQAKFKKGVVHTRMNMSISVSVDMH